MKVISTQQSTDQPTDFSPVTSLSAADVTVKGQSCHMEGLIYWKTKKIGFLFRESLVRDILQWIIQSS